MRNELPTVERLQSLFTYEDGKLLWKVSKAKNVKIGGEAGTVKPHGYRSVQVDWVGYLTHRLIWKMIKGEEPPKYLDHINQNKLDNRIENLRVVTNSQNLLNNKAKGCTFHKASGKWKAEIGIDGKLIYLGLFDTEAEAVAKYQQVKAKIMEGISN